MPRTKKPNKTTKSTKTTARREKAPTTRFATIEDVLNALHGTATSAYDARRRSTRESFTRTALTALVHQKELHALPAETLADRAIAIADAIVDRLLPVAAVAETAETAETPETVKDESKAVNTGLAEKLYGELAKDGANSDVSQLLTSAQYETPV